MSYFNLEKVGRSRTNVIDAATGELLCQLSNKDVAGWVYRTTKARDEDKAFEVERRARRLEIAKGYLAARAARPSASQLNLF
jgi:hypothetical protein